mmetsp:Transcript_19459/g.36264  ORF Transcript_19459/g.36264 Transcript_19459/m.36264 type:complete len:276 (+) Transcript_19459:36-863(+)
MDLRQLSETPAFQHWMVGLPVAYMVIAGTFRLVNLFPEKLPLGSRSSDYISFDIVAGSTLTFMSYVGFTAWFNLQGPQHEWSSSAVEGDKFYSNADFVTNHLIIPMLSYQLWNTVICLLLNDLRKPVMILHHIVTASLAYGCTYPYGAYYTIFFFGVAESTNIPLTILDIIEKLKLEKKYAAIFKVCQVCFLLSFFIIRVFMWTVTIYYYLTESAQLIIDGVAHSKFHVITNFFSSFFLTGLQYYWGYCMIVMVAGGELDTDKQTDADSKQKKMK